MLIRPALKGFNIGWGFTLGGGVVGRGLVGLGRGLVGLGLGRGLVGLGLQLWGVTAPVCFGDHHTTTEVILLPWQWVRGQIPLCLGLASKRGPAWLLLRLLLMLDSRHDLRLSLGLSMAQGWPRLWRS